MFSRNRLKRLEAGIPESFNEYENITALIYPVIHDHVIALILVENSESLFCHVENRVKISRVTSCMVRVDTPSIK